MRHDFFAQISDTNYHLEQEFLRAIPNSYWSMRLGVDFLHNEFEAVVGLCQSMAGLRLLCAYASSPFSTIDRKQIKGITLHYLSNINNKQL
jgi:hypothetical protein